VAPKEMVFRTTIGKKKKEGDRFPV